jgi:hypothetical protein
MSDDAAPYERAIEETAKATGKALDIVKATAGPVAEIYGLIIGDKIQAARQRRLDAIMRKTRKILKDRDIAETAEVAEQIALPLLEAAQGEPREEMQEWWARLLANAMDPARQGDVRPEFIQTLKKLEPLDAMILSKLSGLDRNSRERDAVARLVNVRVSLADVSLRHLVSERCLQFHEMTATYVINSFGEELVRACSQ